ncbi:MAG: hypothetical protein AAGG75_27630 [Bacteroidota bacterium]
MKNLMLLVGLMLISSLGMTSCNEPAYGKPYTAYASMLNFDDMDIKNIQEKIYNTFVQSVVAKKDDELIALRAKLEEASAAKGNALIDYWRGYLQYYYAIYYMQKGDKLKSAEEVDKGIDIMDKIKNKNSEDFALMAMLQSFAIQFRKGMMAGIMSSKVKKNVKKAMELDESNVRAFYVAANSDYYTPEKYGGGKKAEDYLLKAIELPSQKMKNEYLPSWGKGEAYKLLVELYIKREDWDNAKNHYQAAVAEFPDDYNISKLATKLVGK